MPTPRTRHGAFRFAHRGRCVRGLFILLALACTSAGCTGAPSSEPTPQTVAFVNARIVVGSEQTADGSGPVIEHGTLVTREGRIIGVGPRETVDLPPEADQIDLAGRTIIPGLINAHGHVNNVRGLDADPAFYTEAHVEAQLARYARYGVTTVVSLGGGGPAGVAVRDRRERGDSYARLRLAGPAVSPETPAGADAAVRTISELGADIVKIRVDDNLGTTPKMPRDVYQAVVAAAETYRLPVAAHVYYLDDAKALLRAGVDLIAHSVRDVAVDAEIATLLIERGACYCPTLMREVSTFVYAERPDWFDDPFFLREVDPAVVAALAAPAYQEQVRHSPSATAYRQALDIAKANLKALADAGVRIAMGTDSGPPGRFQGYFEHLELELMVDAGLTPLQALIAATGDAAHCMGLDDTGILEPGRWADFVVLRANPLEAIQNMRAIDSVWIAGARVDVEHAARFAHASIPRLRQ